MPHDPPARRSAFITCSARAVISVARLTAEIEHALLDGGWRTRVPNRVAASAGIGLDERRRLAERTRQEIERAGVLVHVPAPAHLAGALMHRELGRALRHQVPVILVVATADRQRLDIGLPAPDRIEQLLATTGGHRLDRLEDLASLADRVARPVR